MAAKEKMSNNDPEIPGTEVSAPAVEILPNTTEETVTMSKATLCREAITVASIGASR
jgi:hypothetical protein